MGFIPRVSPRWDEPHHLAQIVAKLEGAQTAGLRLCVSVPPRHGKTELLLHAIGWMLLRDPTTEIMYLSYGSRFAQSKSARARDLAVRAGVRLHEASRSKHEWLTTQGGGLRSAGVDSAITGFGAHVIIIDDIVKNRGDAESQLIRQRTWDFYTSTARTRLEPGGSIIVCGTRWHTDDLIGKLLAEPELGFEEINLPAIDDDGAPLWPERFTLDDLADIKAASAYDWESLYQGQPRSRDGRLFADPVTEDYPPSSGTYAIGVDLAYTAKSRADHSAAVVLCKTRDNRFHVVEVVRERSRLASQYDEAGALKSRGFASQLVRLSKRYPGARMCSYIGGREDVILELLGTLSHGEAVHIESIKAISDKWARAQGYAAAWNRGDVAIARKDWADHFISEHVSFNGRENEPDDQVDAAAAAFDCLAGGTFTGPTTGGGERVTHGLKHKRWT